MNFVNKLIIGVLSAFLVASLIFNFVLYKGLQINIDKSMTTTNHNESFATSMSGSLIVNGEFYNGNVFERKKEIFETEEEAEVFLQKLNVFSWLWAKEFFDVKTNKYIVKYPYFFIENKKQK